MARKKKSKGKQQKAIQGTPKAGTVIRSVGSSSRVRATDGQTHECIVNGKWKNVMKILKRKDTHFVTEQILSITSAGSTNNNHRTMIDILWNDAPVHVLCCILQICSQIKELKEDDIHDERDENERNLMKVKIITRQWDVLIKLIKEFPHIVSMENAYNALWEDIPVDILESILELQPTAPMMKEEGRRRRRSLVRHLIKEDRLEHFCTILQYCPTIAKIKHRSILQHHDGDDDEDDDDDHYMTPIFMIFQYETSRKDIIYWFNAIIRVYPNAVKEKNEKNGQMPLHLIYRYHRADITAEFQQRIVDTILQIHPMAETMKDNFGHIPSHYSSS